MLGGTNATNPAYPFSEPTFFWSETSRYYPNCCNQPNPHGIGYVGYHAGIFFDSANGMHVSWDVFVKNGEEPSHVMYAFSPDGGQRFYKANGVELLKPITYTVPGSNYDAVHVSSTGNLDTHTYVGRAKSGHPIVAFNRTSGPRQSFFKIWNGATWGAEQPFDAGRPALMVTDQNGVITAVKNGSFLRSHNNGQSWTTHTLPGIANTTESTVIDDLYLREHGHFIFQSAETDNNNQTVRIHSLEFSDTQPPPSPPGQGPAAPTNLTATAQSATQINLAWTDNSSDETVFRIQRKTDAGGTYADTSPATVGTGVTTFNNTGLTASTTYFYRVRAENASGNSAWSNEANATTQSAGSGFVDGGIYELEPLNAPGKRLTVTGGAGASGTNVEINADTSAAHQRWTARLQTGGVWELEPTHATSQRLNVQGGGTASGANVNIANDLNVGQQRWTVTLQTDANGNYELAPTHAGATNLRLNVAGGGIANGTNVNAVTDNNQPAQRWKLFQQ